MKRWFIKNTANMIKPFNVTHHAKNILVADMEI
jgi:hypothetical protein